MSEEQKTITNRDPKAGCVIMIVGALIFTGLLLYTITLPFKQSGLMSDFTQSESAQLLTKEDVKPPSSSFLARLKGVAGTEGASQTSLTLTVDEMNTAIHHYEEFEELQGAMEVKVITPEEILFNISFPLRGRPFSDEVPHLNGVMHAIPEMQDGEIALNVSKIESAIGEVPEGFLKHFQPYQVMAKYIGHEHIGRAMFACEKITLEEGKINLTFNTEKYTDPKAIETKKSDLKRKQKRSTMMTIFSFILVGGLFFFLIQRRNKNATKTYRDAE